jgi:hypothetical protein
MGLVFATSACSRGEVLPGALDDQTWWRLIETLSEPAGTFDLSDNFVSNEPDYADRVRWLRPSGGGYLGVGPEQNFSYIAALRPDIAFIVDIRRENRNLHLLYKALFELAGDRVEFVSHLFARPRPAGLRPDASVDEIFERFAAVPPSRALYDSTAALVRERLLTVHRLPLSEADLDWIARASEAFFVDGPDIVFWGDRTVDAARPSYRTLMTATDITRQTRSYLAAESAFNFVKDLQMRNLIVPVVGDFGGPRAMRGVGDYVRAHGDVIHAIYASNVSVYLTNQQTLAFCGNLASLPAAPGAQFLESTRMRSLASKLRGCPAGPG